MLHLEELWIKNVTITTGLVDTFSTPTLLRLIEGGSINPSRLVTHHFGMGEFEKAYEVFSRASDTGALKVVLEA
jgi:alcohol dehydrogenase